MRIYYHFFKELSMLKNIQLWGGGGLALSLLLITGCGTITNGTKQKVSIETSSGDSVLATIDGKKVTLPIKDMEVSRKKGAYIQVLKEDNPCFENTNYYIKRDGGISGGYWLNLIGLVAGGIGVSSVTTDLVSGGAWQYDNPNFVVPVTKKPNCTPPAKPKVTESKESTESKQDKKAKEGNKQETKQNDDKAQDKAKTTDTKKQKSKK